MCENLRKKKEINMKQTNRCAVMLGRRAFLSYGSLCLFGSIGAFSGSQSVSMSQQSGNSVLRIGLVTDVHYADKPNTGTRYYRESIPKMRECIQKFNHANASIALELGDFVDAAETIDEETHYLQTMVTEFSKFQGDRHYVPGNHCVWTLTKQQFLETCGQERSYYSFDRENRHFIVLDACFRKDGVPYGNRNYEWTDTDIPAPEIEWLKADLKTTSKPTILFVHQRLDVSGHYGIHSAPAVREILEKSDKVFAVFQGHSHENDYKEIGGIHYCTLAALVEGSGSDNNAYALLDIFPDGSMRVDGFRRQLDYSL